MLGHTTYVVHRSLYFGIYLYVSDGLVWHADDKEESLPFDKYLYRTGGNHVC